MKIELHDVVEGDGHFGGLWWCLSVGPGWVVVVSRWEVNVGELVRDALGGWDFADVGTSSAVVMGEGQHDEEGDGGFLLTIEDRDLSFGVCRVTNEPSGSGADSSRQRHARQGLSTVHPAHPDSGLRCQSKTRSRLSRVGLDRRLHPFGLEKKFGCFSRKMRDGCIGSCSHAVAPYYTECVPVMN